MFGPLKPSGDMTEGLATAWFEYEFPKPLRITGPKFIGACIGTEGEGTMGACIGL